MSIADLGRYKMSHVRNLESLCQFVHNHHEQGVRLLAGGTDLMVEISQGGQAPDPLPHIVDVSRLSELRNIDWDGKRLRIGAAVTYLEMQRNEDVKRHAPLVAQMTYDLGGPTIQARGTLGGNLATGSPAADGVAAIAPFEPTIEVRSVRGTRRIAMRDFQRGYKVSSRHPDEVIVAVELKTPPEGSPWVWRKVGTRLAQAISKVAFGAIAVVEGGPNAEGKNTAVIKRFGASMASVGPVTALMRETSAYLLGAKVADLKPEALDTAIDRDISPIDDVRSTGAYRRHCARALIRSFVRELGAAIP